MRVCAICDGSGSLIRWQHGKAATPKLGEAGTDDCPDCGGTGLDLGPNDRTRRRSAVLMDQIEEMA